MPEIEKDLDSYSSIYVDAIRYRENAAKASMQLAKNEFEACGLMKKELMSYIFNSLGLSPATHNLTVKDKKVIITEIVPEQQVS